MTVVTSPPMDATVDLALEQKLRGVSMLMDSGPLKFRSAATPKSSNHPRSASRYLHTHETDTDSKNINISFRSLFHHYPSPDTTETTVISKLPEGIVETKTDRMRDAFNKSENLLHSTDNIRPQSKTKHTLPPSGKLTRNGQIYTLSPNPPNALHSYMPDSAVRNIFSEAIKPPDITNKDIDSKRPSSRQSFKEDTCTTNNAQHDSLDTVVLEKKSTDSKKVKKQRKRLKSSHKPKRSKQGRISVPATGLRPVPQKRFSAPTLASANTQSNNIHISSEPLLYNKNSVVPNALKLYCHEHAYSTKKDSAINANTCTAGNDKHRTRITSAKSGPAGGTCTATHYTHGSPNTNSPIVNDLALENTLHLHSKQVILHKSETLKRVKSGNSIKSDPFGAKIDSCNHIQVSSSPINNEQLSVMGNLTQVFMKGTAVPHLSSPPVPSEKESVLTSIYGGSVNQVPCRVTHAADETKRVKKIFLSDRQSGTLKENGGEFPCAPPATPIPDVLDRIEFIPCMSDIRSQRAVKNRLHVMEREAIKKKEKQKEANVKLEKQQTKERKKDLKTRQRREIYALNKVMTELEHCRFLEFCRSKGLNAS